MCFSVLASLVSTYLCTPARTGTLRPNAGLPDRGDYLHADLEDAALLEIQPV